MPRKVLVVEDDRAIRRGVVDALRFAGFETVDAGDGEEGLKQALVPGIDLVLLDVLMPKKDGFTVLEELRRARPGLPVIVLTAKGAEEDRVRGLKGGADDYVVKPFSANELLARVDAVLRRSPERPRSIGSSASSSAPTTTSSSRSRPANSSRASAPSSAGVEHRPVLGPP